MRPTPFVLASALLLAPTPATAGESPAPSGQPANDVRQEIDRMRQEMAVAAQAPAGQSVSDLRQEIDRLRQEIAKRDADLDAALKRIKELEKDLTAARTPVPAAQPPAQAPEPVPADPTIGPGGLLSAIQADYLAAFPAVPDASDDQKLGLHFRALEGWCTKANRDGIRQYSWNGRIDPGTVQVSGRDVAFTVVFTNGTKDYRVPVTAEQSVIARIRTRDGLDTGPLTLTGVARPLLRVNPNRPAPGAFENPPMVAPYLEFLVQFDLKSVVPAAEPKQ